MEDLNKYIRWNNDEDYNNSIKFLSELAIPEKWNFGNESDNRILKEYLNHTINKLRDNKNCFLKLKDKIVFNTGLETVYFDPIYLFARWDEELGRWKYAGFMTEYDLCDMEIYTLPQRPDYFADPSLLVFDVRSKINFNIREILESVACHKTVPDNIVHGAIETSICQAKYNFNYAVPCYYSYKIHVLLPLYLENSDQPSVALSLYKMPGGYYQACRCLSLEDAYIYARLIAKPESDWLIP